jgi:hypothetical protein
MPGGHVTRQLIRDRLEKPAVHVTGNVQICYEWTPVTPLDGDGKLTDRGHRADPLLRRSSRATRSVWRRHFALSQEWMSLAPPTMVTWRDVRHRYEAIAQQAVPQPALYAAVATGLTGLMARTRLGPPTHRPTSRRVAVAVPAAAAGPSAAERGPAGRPATRL